MDWECARAEYPHRPPVVGEYAMSVFHAMRNPIPWNNEGDLDSLVPDVL